MGTLNDPQNLRKHKRYRTLHSVRWDHRSSENQQGKIRDISPEGVFLAPIGTMPEDIRVNDPVWVVLRVHGTECFLSGKVRWRGMSKEHGKIGFGLEFDENSKKVSEGLCLQMSENNLFFIPA